MHWLLIAYLIGLLYLAVNRNKVPGSGSLRAAWVCYALIPVAHFVFNLIRAGNIRSPRSMQLVEIWEDGVCWLLLGISLLSLSGIVGGGTTDSGSRDLGSPRG